MSDLKVRLSGYLPSAEMDGLQPLLQGLVDEPKQRRVVVAIIDTQTRRDHGDGDFEPTVRVLQIEAPQGDLKDAALDLLHKAYAARTGAMQMFEDDGADWGVGGQAGRPLNPDQPEEGAAVGDQADPEQEPWQQVDDDDPFAEDAIPDAELVEAVEDGLVEQAEEAAAEEEPFQTEEPPQPVKDQVAAKRGRRKETTEA